MSEISDEVDVTVDSNTAVISRDGYGVPLIFSHTATWTELVRQYGKLSDVLVDFASTTPEYLAASKLFSAKNPPPVLLIGHGDASRKPTLRWAITPTAVNNGVYKMTVAGNLLSFTADGTATQSEINIGLKALIDALSLPLTVSDQTTFMRIVETVAGAFHSISTVDSKLSLVQDHADPGVATDLAAINLERPDWFGLITLYNSKAYVLAAAAWAQANTKMYLFQTQDSDVPNTAYSGGSATDVVTVAKGLAEDHVIGIYSKETADFADAAWFGRCLPLTPGKETWKFKQLIGVTPGVYTSTQRANMRAKCCNFYNNTKGVPMTEEGHTVTGAFIDFVRYIDSLKSGMGEDVFGPFVEEDRIGFDDNGIAGVENIVAGHLQRDEKSNILNKGWTTSVPKLADISQADKDSRLLEGVEFEALYVGAIHKVKIHGRVVQ